MKKTAFCRAFSLAGRAAIAFLLGSRTRKQLERRTEIVHTAADRADVAPQLVGLLAHHQPCHHGNNSQQRKMAELKKRNELCVLLVGLAFLAVGTVFMVIWYVKYYNIPS